MREVTLILLGLLTLVAGSATLAAPPGVAELLEDDPETLLKQFTNPPGEGEGHAEKAVVYSGKASVRLVPTQRFHPAIPGWNYRITENPKAGEYRYLRFAWKVDGCAGIMLQLHDRDWGIRYTAGVDRFNWGTKFVAPAPTSDWRVVTCDLFKDFGTRTITGIALTAFDGRAAYFDHIYLGRTVEDLDRIDATGIKRPAEPTVAELDRLWRDLGGEDAAKDYLAFWNLVAAPKAVTFLDRKLATSSGVDAKRLRQWIADLDDDAFGVREAATTRLADHIEDATGLLEEALRTNTSAEVRLRAERLLAARKPGGEPVRLRRAVRVLEYTATAEAERCLERLTKEAGRTELVEAAKASLARLRQKK